MSDRLSDNRIPIVKVVTSKHDSQCTLQISDDETEAVENEVNTPISLDVIREAQHKDDSINTVIQYLKTGAPPNNSDLRNMSEESKVLLHSAIHCWFVMKFYIVGTTTWMVLPSSFSWWSLEV